MIYGIVDHTDSSVVKIGYTNGSPTWNTVRGRLGGHQTSHWRAIVCIAMAPGERRDERQLHCEFDHYCVRGEWFLNHGEVARWVEKWRLDVPRTLEIRRRGPRIVTRYSPTSAMTANAVPYEGKAVCLRCERGLMKCRCAGLPMVATLRPGEWVRNHRVVRIKGEPTPNVVTTSRHVRGKKSKYTCFKCGQSGHYGQLCQTEAQERAGLMLMNSSIGER